MDGSMVPDETEVAIVGAGPYGLSIAAHLRAAGIAHRIFGRPMSAWQTQMVQGMFLKSDGFASNLASPGDGFTLERYCAERGLPYGPFAFAIPRDTFVEYGVEFQRRYVPALETKLVAALSRNAAGFELRLDDGETLFARHVILAVGIGWFRHTPPRIEALPEAVRSHSVDHGPLDRLSGRDVTILGGGASAVDLAVALDAAGSTVRLVARHKVRLHTQAPPLPWPWWKHLKTPISGIGQGWPARILADFPQVFHHLPERIRLPVVRRALGPAAGWFMRERVARIPFLEGYSVARAEASGARVRLDLDGSEGARSLETEHVVAATGYRVDVAKIEFLEPGLREAVRTVGGTPVLNRFFESSVPGLYFVGTAAANSFGPLLRFVVGAEFAAPKIARRLARMRDRGSLPAAYRLEGAAAAAPGH